MNTRPSNLPIFFLVALALLWYAQRQGIDLSDLLGGQGGESPSAVVPSPPGATASLSSIPRQDAAYWAGMLEGIGRQVEGNQGIQTMFDVEALRDRALSAPLRSVSGGEQIGAVMAPLLEQLGTGSERLDEGGRRQKVANVFRGVATALRGG